MERQFLLAVPLIFSVDYPVPHREEIFMTSLPTVLHCKILLWRYLILVIIILLKNKYLRREEYITGMLYVTLIEG